MSEKNSKVDAATKDAKNAKDAGVAAAPNQAREPVTQVSIPTKRGEMTASKAKELGLDPTIYGDDPEGEDE